RARPGTRPRAAARTVRAGLLRRRGVRPRRGARCLRHRARRGTRRHRRHRRDRRRHRAARPLVRRRGAAHPDGRRAVVPHPRPRRRRRPRGGGGGADMSALTLLLVLLPTAGAVCTAGVPRRLATRFGAVAASLTFLDALLILAVFDYRAAGSMQLEIDWS